MTRTKVLKPLFLTKETDNCQHGLIIYFQMRSIKVLLETINNKTCTREKLLDTSLIVYYGKTSFESYEIKRVASFIHRKIRKNINVTLISQ